MPQEYLSNSEQLDQTITSLSIELTTIDAHDANTDSRVYCNVVFKDGSLLFAPLNFELDTPNDDRERGQTDFYPLPIPDGFQKRIVEIDELYIRKSGSDGWLLGSALLFANDVELPVIGNSQINQFLDNDDAVLNIRDWSTRSICAPSSTDANAPLVCAPYRIGGPVLGQISENSANVLYRVDREGDYKLRVFEAASGQVVFEQVNTLSPTTTFHIPSLQANTHYTFSFFYINSDQDIPLPEGDGEFRTFPPESIGVKFSLAFGSCSRNSYEVTQNVWMGIRNLAPDPSIDPLVNGGNEVRTFIHLGDTFYFYDDITDEEPENLPTILAANLSQRKQPGFLEMAGRIPCIGVWDDHDFREDNGDSKGYEMKGESLKGFLDYWGNNTLSQDEFGLTTLFTYGNIDIYLMDGRFLRDKDSDICFTREQLDQIVRMITRRGRRAGRLVILASGSTWNHTNDSGDAYGHDRYEEEREAFYSRLNRLIGNQIRGLIFLSGDIHINEIFEIQLARELDEASNVAPEFVSSPLGYNSSLDRSANAIKNERKWSIPSKGSNAKRGFATLEIDTTNPEPEENWTIRVNYHDANSTSTTPYHSKEYTLKAGQFIF